MRSSISSSECDRPDRTRARRKHADRIALDRAGFVRLTASDRPGLAQPVPVRDIPPQPWRPIFVGMLLLTALLIASWEMYWRAYGVAPSYRNSNGQWAQQRRRIDTGEGGKTVLIGSSRMLFDVQLPVWEKITGERPIQLAIEGTSPVPMLEDLAADPDFTGRLLVGVAPQQYFGAFSYRADVLPYFHRQGPSQRSGNWLSMLLLEPYLAFYDPDFALATVIKRQAWPARPGLPQRTDVRKLRVSEADRNTRMWDKVEVDPEYRDLARRIWAQAFGAPPSGMETPAKAKALIDAQIDKTVAAVAKLRAHGVKVVFVRLPSTGKFYAYEQKYLPRADTWDLLLQRTGAPGIHFENHLNLQGYEQPDWSHLAPSAVDRFTAALVPLVEDEFRQQASGPDAHLR
jgi:hypothetical protein